VFAVDDYDERCDASNRRRPRETEHCGASRELEASALKSTRDDPRGHSCCPPASGGRSPPTISGIPLAQDRRGHRVARLTERRGADRRRRWRSATDDERASAIVAVAVDEAMAAGHLALRMSGLDHLEERSAFAPAVGPNEFTAAKIAIRGSARRGTRAFRRASGDS